MLQSQKTDQDAYQVYFPEEEPLLQHRKKKQLVISENLELKSSDSVVIGTWKQAWNLGRQKYEKEIAKQNPSIMQRTEACDLKQILEVLTPESH